MKLTAVVAEKTKPYALVREVLAGWEHYEPLAAAISDPIPEGLLLHVAGPTEVGFRTIEVWESEAAWRRFRERLNGLFDHLPLQPLVRELHIRDLVSPPAVAGSQEIAELEQGIEALRRVIAAARLVS